METVTRTGCGLPYQDKSPEIRQRDIKLMELLCYSGSETDDVNTLYDWEIPVVRDLVHKGKTSRWFKVMIM